MGYTLYCRSNVDNWRRSLSCHNSSPVHGLVWDEQHHHSIPENLIVGESEYQFISSCFMYSSNLFLNTTLQYKLKTTSKYGNQEKQNDLRLALFSIDIFLNRDFLVFL